MYFPAFQSKSLFEAFLPLLVFIKWIRNELHVLITDWTLILGSVIKGIMPYLKAYINIDFLASTQNGNDCETTQSESTDTL